MSVVGNQTIEITKAEFCARAKKTLGWELFVSTISSTYKGWVPGVFFTPDTHPTFCWMLGVLRLALCKLNSHPAPTNVILSSVRCFRYLKAIFKKNGHGQYLKETTGARILKQYKF